MKSFCMYLDMPFSFRIKVLDYVDQMLGGGQATQVFVHIYEREEFGAARLWRCVCLVQCGFNIKSLSFASSSSRPPPCENIFIEPIIVLYTSAYFNATERSLSYLQRALLICTVETNATSSELNYEARLSYFFHPSRSSPFNSYEMTVLIGCNIFSSSFFLCTVIHVFFTSHQK